MSRLIVLDTETTGLDPSQGHRIIEIGCIEMAGRRPSGRSLHRYINPERHIDAGAAEVHGINDEFVADKPVFGTIAEEFLDFVDGAELIIHNAAFDIGFLNAELARLSARCKSMEEICTVTDTLVMARKLYPGQRNTLDALCKRLGIDNSSRQLHGALLDAQLLAEVYVGMTSGQVSLDLAVAPRRAHVVQVEPAGGTRTVLNANGDELAAHTAWLDDLDAACKQGSVWRRDGSAPD
ncbi:MAG: DNA polymerase III subunit epsilon [Rhodanobacteraceae bacterium]